MDLQQLDLTSLESIRAAAEQLKSTHDMLDLLINNAGVMFTPKSTTKDGFELQFGTNHLGHFAFTGLLLDRVLETPGSRIVTVSSVGHRFARNGIRFDDLQWEQSYNRYLAYGQSKLANLMFTYELQRRLAGTDTIAAAAHPGGSRTELTRNLPPLLGAASGLLEPLFQDAAMGALPTLRAATDPGVLGGQYFGPDGFAEQRGYPWWWPPAGHRTTSTRSAGFGRSPRNSRRWSPQSRPHCHDEVIRRRGADTGILPKDGCLREFHR